MNKQKLLELAKKYNKILIVGAPNSGKTYLSKYLENENYFVIHTDDYIEKGVFIDSHVCVEKLMYEIRNFYQYIIEGCSAVMLLLQIVYKEWDSLLPDLIIYVKNEAPVLSKHIEMKKLIESQWEEFQLAFTKFQKDKTIEVVEVVQYIEPPKLEKEKSKETDDLFSPLTKEILDKCNTLRKNLIKIKSLDDENKGIREDLTRFGEDHNYMKGDFGGLRWTPTFKYSEKESIELAKQNNIQIPSEKLYKEDIEMMLEYARKNMDTIPLNVVEEIDHKELKKRLKKSKIELKKDFMYYKFPISK